MMKLDPSETCVLAILTALTILVPVLMFSCFVYGTNSAERIELARIQLAAAQYCGGGK